MYNFQHDLESVWWILLWSATSRVSHPPSIAWSRDIFRNTMSPSQPRLDCLLLSIASTLKARLHPSLQSFVAPLEVLRTNIYAEYIERRNAQAMSDHTSYIRIHRIFDAFFHAIRRTQATWGGTALVTQHQSVVTNNNTSNPGRRKRTAPHDNSDYVPKASESERDSTDEKSVQQRKKPRGLKMSSRGKK